MRSRSVLLAAVLVPLALAATSPARAQSTDAETHFKRGVSLYQETDFKGALVEFRRAHELSQNWRLLYNVAQAEYQTRDYAAALASFETFLREGGEKIPRARRAEVDQEVARLRLRVGKLTIRANVGGATVVIDDEPVGSAPLVRNVAVGGRRIAVKKEGYVSWAKTLEVVSGDDVLLDATLEAAPSLAPPPPHLPHREAPSYRITWEPWVATGVLTAAALTTGIVALSAASKLDTAKGRFDVSDSELADDASRVKTFALATDILVVAALAAAGVSLYFTLTAPVRVSPGASGFVAWGRF